MNETWTLIVLMAGLLPPQGFIQYGFESEMLCQLEAAHYCSRAEKQFRCKCEPHLKPPGMSFDKRGNHE